jgi:hypothetical protein
MQTTAIIALIAVGPIFLLTGLVLRFRPAGGEPPRRNKALELTAVLAGAAMITLGGLLQIR